jgi:endo-1,4-beta-D-glucanase Y
MRNVFGNEIGKALLVVLAVGLAAPLACSNPPDDGAGDDSGGGGGGKGGKGGSGSGGKGSGGKGAGGSPGAGGADDTGGSPGSGGSATGGSPGTGGMETGGTPGAGGAAATGFQFGAHPMKYPAGTARPSGGQAALDGQVISFFQMWKAAYLRNDCAGGYYLYSNGGAGAGADTFLTTSEAHGYAMVIFALMNGVDPQAHEIFDGLLAMMKKYASVNTKDLMAWGIDKGCKPVVGNDSASDGDLDMGYALLLADKIWGSSGTNNYGELAKAVLTAVKSGDMNPSTKLPKLGDWVDSAAPEYFYTRPSDFMLDHYRAFAKTTGDQFWTGTVGAIYGLVDYMQANYSPMTGLIPDFIMNTNSMMPKQIPMAITNNPNGLAEDLHADYDYNSCRVPWRLGTDYVVTGDPAVKARIAKINSFIMKQTGGDPSKIIDGYSLAGMPWTGMGAGENGCFTASFGTGAIVDAGNQAWVDGIWERIRMSGLENDEYTASVKLLNMIVMSGNWWAP